MAPASFSMLTEMSPVCAPCGLAWQSCAPTLSAEPFAAPVIWAINVAGGQRSISQAGAGWAASSAATSASEALVPFIFQLPAASFFMLQFLLRVAHA